MKEISCKAGRFVTVLTLLMISLSTQDNTAKMTFTVYHTYTHDYGVKCDFNLQRREATIVRCDAMSSTGDMVMPKQVYDNDCHTVSRVARSALSDNNVNMPTYNDLVFRMVPTQLLERNF